MTINIRDFRELYISNPAVEGVCEVLAGFVNNRKVSTVERLLSQLKAEGYKVVRQDIVTAFRMLQELGLGTFIIGRGGHPSRMEWAVKTRLLQEMAASENQDENSLLEAVEEAQDENEDFIQHSFVVRPDLTVEFSLPANLTTDEAYRLGQFLGAAAFDDAFSEPGLIEHQYYLRPRVLITLELPADLDSREADALDMFAGNLSFQR